MVFAMRNGIYLYSSFIAELYFRWIIWQNNGGVSLSLREKLCRIIEFVFASVRFPRICQLERHGGISHLTVSRIGDLKGLCRNS